MSVRGTVKVNTYTLKHEIFSYRFHVPKFTHEILIRGYIKQHLSKGTMQWNLTPKHVVTMQISDVHNHTSAYL